MHFWSEEIDRYAQEVRGGLWGWESASGHQDPGPVYVPQPKGEEILFSPGYARGLCPSGPAYGFQIG